MKQIESTLAVVASVAVGVLVVVVVAVRLPPTPPAPVVDPAGTTQLTAAAQPTATDVDPTLGAPTIAISELARRVKMGQIKSIEVVDQHAIVTSQDGQQQFVVNVSPDTSLPDVLRQFGVTPDQLASVDYEVQDAPFGGNLDRLIFVLLSLVVGAIVLVGVWEGGRVSNNGYTAFARSTARLWEGGRQPGVRFADVAGVGEAIQELEDVVEFLRDPQKFSVLGARIPRGVLLIGPTGNGKTLLARAVAGEAGVPFFSIAGSTFVEMFAGVGATRVRDLFAQAKKRAPCIVFVDEIDAVGRQRGTGHGSDEREQTLNQVLVEMDGFDTSTNVIVIGATNRPDVLDPALIRPGRFDRRVVLSAPDSAGRNAILRVHAGSKPFDAGVDFSTLARVTPGLSGAELANVINEAAILAVRRDKQVISMPELEEAIDRVTAGVQHQSRVVSDREKRLTAYHEAGHAVVGHFLPNHDPPYAISIVSRTRIGGSTRFAPAEDRRYMTRSQLNDLLASCLGGVAAEFAVFHEVSTMVGDDIQRATNIARGMITRFGMSERLGPVGLDAEAIDDEIRRLIDEALSRAMSIISEHRELLRRLALELVEKESLDSIDLERIFHGAGLAISPLPSRSREAAA